MIVVALIVSLLLNGLAVYLGRIAVKRLLQYDKMLRTVGEDIELNLGYLNDMLSNHISTNAPEIVELDRNLKVMRDRFIEVASAISDVHDDEEQGSTEVA